MIVTTIFISQYGDREQPACSSYYLFMNNSSQTNNVHMLYMSIRTAAK